MIGRINVGWTTLLPSMILRNGLLSLVQSCWLKSFTSAYGCDFEVQSSMCGMPTIINHIFRRFHGFADLHKFSVGRMRLSEVGAQSTLAVVNVKHSVLLCD